MGDGVNEIESMLEKIWDLHDKLSDAIHSVYRAHFLNSVKHPPKPDELSCNRRKKSPDDPDQNTGPGFVFVKDFRVDGGEPAIQEAKSLYAIRTALENLEDHLELFHTVQMQQLTERDSAIARLEQSRIILSMRLAEHQGKKYNVIEEVRALVGNCQNASLFVSPEHFYGPTPYSYGASFEHQKRATSNPLVNFFLSTFTFVSKSLRLDHTAGILGNAALLAASMLALWRMNQDHPTFAGETRKMSRSSHQISDTQLSKLDVFMARG